MATRRRRNVMLQRLFFFIPVLGICLQIILHLYKKVCLQHRPIYRVCKFKNFLNLYHHNWVLKKRLSTITFLFALNCGRRKLFHCSQLFVVTAQNHFYATLIFYFAQMSRTFGHNAIRRIPTMKNYYGKIFWN